MPGVASARSHSSFAGDTEQTVVPPSILARLKRQVQQRPDAVAALDDQHELTFADLDARSSAWAASLAAYGVSPNDCVPLLLDRSLDFIVAALAVWKCGAAYLPLDPSTPQERLALIAQDASAKVLLTHASKAAICNGPWTTIDVKQLPSEPDALFAPAEANAHDLAYVIYTSGSTGAPKGVEITHANLLNLIDWHQEAFQITADDRASQVAGFGFDAAVWEIWPHLAAGATLHMASEETRRSPQSLRDWLVEQRITVAFVPTILAEPLLQSSWPADAALRFMLTGADVLHRRPIAGLPFALVNNYGPSECAVVATSGLVPAAADALHSQAELPSIGRPIRNTTVHILDENLRPVPDGDSGELCLAGALVGRGYRNQPQLTASRFVNYQPPTGPAVRIYRTGDRARFLPSGEIAFLGRLDQQIKIRGYRIEPGEIITWLDRHPGVEASAIKAVADDAGASLVAYIALKAGSTVTSATLREYLAKHLPDYMIPTSFVKLDTLPITANGKLDRNALPNPTAENTLASGAPVTPLAAAGPATPEGGEVTARLAKLVATLLNQPAIGPHDNFFMAGGHSMMGVQLVAQIRETFGVKLALRQLFSAPTVVELSKEIARQLKS